MIAVLSPAKTLDFTTPPQTRKHSQPEFLAEAEELVGGLAKLSKAKVQGLMGISDALAELNAARFKEWRREHSPGGAKQALLAFRGEVYLGFELPDWKAADFDFAQKHLRILSGLYGALRPLDLIHPYRLEMGTKFKNARGKDLYAFWGEKIAGSLAAAMGRSKVLVNLASQEYFGAVATDVLGAEVVTPVFKDRKGEGYKVIAVYAKRARGMMADFIVRRRAKKPADLLGFDGGGYRYAGEGDREGELLFVRG